MQKPNRICSGAHWHGSEWVISVICCNCNNCLWQLRLHILPTPSPIRSQQQCSLSSLISSLVCLLMHCLRSSAHHEPWNHKRWEVGIMENQGAVKAIWLTHCLKKFSGLTTKQFAGMKAVALKLWSWASNISSSIWEIVRNANYQAPVNQKLRVEPRILYFNKLSTWFWCRLKFESQEEAKNSSWLSKEHTNFTSQRVWPSSSPWTLAPGRFIL